jgi:hypothetical protein
LTGHSIKAHSVIEFPSQRGLKDIIGFCGVRQILIINMSIYNKPQLLLVKFSEQFICLEKRNHKRQTNHGKSPRKGKRTV